MGFLDEAKKAQLREIAEAVAKDNFLELFDLRVRPQGKQLLLTVVLDKKNGKVTLNECSIVSREFEKRLDELDLIESAYLLEVSSPGMDRPLRNLEDCERFRGRLAHFVLREPLEGQISLQGRLGGVVEGKVELIIGKDRALWVPFATAKTAQLVVEV